MDTASRADSHAHRHTDTASRADSHALCYTHTVSRADGHALRYTHTVSCHSRAHLDKDANGDAVRHLRAE